MPRAIWNGSISFGLVSIGVRAHSAVSDNDVKFHQLDPDGARIRYRKVSEVTGEEVDKDDIQMGFETSKGEYVLFAKGELNELRPTMTRTIEVEDFVDLDEIDPIYFNRTYWLAPSSEAAGRPYRLLAAAMEDQNKVGTGFDDRELRALAPELASRARSAGDVAPSIVAAVPRQKTAVHWVDPTLVVQVTFAEWSPTGNLRHPSYQGRRGDIDPTSVVREPD